MRRVIVSAAVSLTAAVSAGAGRIDNVRTTLTGDTYAALTFDVTGADAGMRYGISYWMDGFEENATTVWCETPLSGSSTGCVFGVCGLTAEFDYRLAPVLGAGDETEIVCTGRTVGLTTLAERTEAGVRIDESTLTANPVEATFRWYAESLGGAESAEVKLLVGRRGGDFDAPVRLADLTVAGAYLPCVIDGLAPGTDYKVKLEMGGVSSQVVEFSTPAEDCRLARVAFPEGGLGVSYVRSNGEQWLDAGVVPGPDTAVEFRFARPDCNPDRGGTVFFGQAAGPYHYTFGQAGGAMSFSGAGDQLGLPALTATNGYACRIVRAAGGGEMGRFALDRDGVAGVERSVMLTADSEKPLGLFAFADGTAGGAFDFLGMRIEKGGRLVRDFRPALDGDDVACLFDTVSQKYFYDRRGLSKFAAGPAAVGPTGVAAVRAEVVAFDGETLVADVTRDKGGRRSGLCACFGPGYGGAITNGWRCCRAMPCAFGLLSDRVSATVSGIEPGDRYLRFWSETDGWSPTLALRRLTAKKDVRPLAAVAGEVESDRPDRASFALDVRSFGTGAKSVTLSAALVYDDDPAKGEVVRTVKRAGVKSAKDLYVQDGLIACWDGEDGLAKDTWRDLVQGAEFAIAKGVYDSTNCCLVYDGQGPDQLKRWAMRVFPAGVKTVELVVEFGDGIALMTPEWTGCAIGEWNRMVLLHNRQRSNAMPFRQGRACTYSVSYAANNALLAACHLNGEAVSQLTPNEWYDANGCRSASIGGRVSAGNFRGRIYALRVYDRVLDDEEAAANAAVDMRRFTRGKREKLVGGREVTVERRIPAADPAGSGADKRVLAKDVDKFGMYRFTVGGLKPDTDYALRVTVDNGLGDGRAETPTVCFRTAKESFGAGESTENAVSASEFKGSDAPHPASGNLIRGIAGVKESGNMSGGNLSELTDGVVGGGDVRIGDGDTAIVWNFGRAANVRAVNFYACWGDARAVIDVTAIEFRRRDGSWRTAPGSAFGAGRSGTRNCAVFAAKNGCETLANGVDAMRIRFNNSQAHGGYSGWRSYREIEVVEEAVTSGVLGLEAPKFDGRVAEAVLSRAATNACDGVYACYGATYGGAETNAWWRTVRLPAGFAAGEKRLPVKVEGLSPDEVHYLRFFVPGEGWSPSHYRK